MGINGTVDVAPLISIERPRESSAALPFIIIAFGGGDGNGLRESDFVVLVS